MMMCIQPVILAPAAGLPRRSPHLAEMAWCLTLYMWVHQGQRKPHCAGPYSPTGRTDHGGWPTNNNTTTAEILINPRAGSAGSARCACVDLNLGVHNGD